MCAHRSPLCVGTGKKRAGGVFLDLDIWKLSGQTLKYGSRLLAAFKGWPETQSIPLIQSSLCEKGVPPPLCLQNDAQIAILRVKGRESVFWKACVELCRVVGSAKTQIRKSTLKKATEKSGFWFLTFPCVSGQTLKHGSDRFTIRSDPCCGFCPEMHWKRSARFCSKFRLFSSVKRH